MGRFDDAIATGKNNYNSIVSKSNEAEQMRLNEKYNIEQMRLRYCEEFKKAIPDFLKAMKDVRPCFNALIGEKTFIGKTLTVKIGEGYFIFNADRYCPTFTKAMFFLTKDQNLLVTDQFLSRDLPSNSSEWERYYRPYDENSTYKLMFAAMMNSYSPNGILEDHYSNSGEYEIKDKTWLEMNDAIANNEVENAVNLFFTKSFLINSTRNLGIIPDSYIQQKCVGVSTSDINAKLTFGSEYDKYME